MGSQFAATIAAGMRTLQAAAGVAVTYHRGPDSVALTAVPGKGTLEVQTARDFIEQVETSDWIIEAADLVLAGSVTLPKPGDRVKQTAGATRTVYEVMTPPYRASDNERLRIRIHTKQTGTEAA
jgi:hypothetical protein